MENRKSNFDEQIEQSIQIPKYLKYDDAPKLKIQVDGFPKRMLSLNPVQSL